jgi:hypothetical protein
MKKRCFGLAVVALWLAAFGIGNAQVPFSGVINPNTNLTMVDTAILNVLTTTDTFLTAGWQASGTQLDTFKFPDLASWPSKVTLIGTIMGMPNSSVFQAPLPDTWYRFQSGSPIAPLAKFISPPTGLEESRSAFEPLQRLSVSPSVVTGQMAVRLQPVGTGTAVVEIHDAVGNVIRSLDCTAGANGTAVATWNREDEFGRLVPEGVYFCRYAASGAVAVRKVLVTH